jgi:hypothetical protein
LTSRTSQGSERTTYSVAWSLDPSSVVTTPGDGLSTTLTRSGSGAGAYGAPGPWSRATNRWTAVVNSSNNNNNNQQQQPTTDNSTHPTPNAALPPHVHPLGASRAMGKPWPTPPSTPPAPPTQRLPDPSPPGTKPGPGLRARSPSRGSSSAPGLPTEWRPGTPPLSSSVTAAPLEDGGGCSGCGAPLPDIFVEAWAVKPACQRLNRSVTKNNRAV